MTKKHRSAMVFAMATTLCLPTFAAAYGADNETQWSGTWVGIDAGGARSYGRQSVRVVDPQQSLSGQGASANQAALFPQSLGNRQSLGAGGAYLKYQQQNGHLVFGVIADATAIERASTSTTSGGTLADPTKAPFPNYYSTFRSRVAPSWLGTLRGSLGYDLGKTLVYATAGFAMGGVHTSTTASITNIDNPPSDTWSGSHSQTKFGYAAGAGAEYAISSKLTIGIDYLYYDLGSTKYRTSPDTFTSTDQPGVNQSISAKVSGSVIRATLAFRL